MSRFEQLVPEAAARNSVLREPASEAEVVEAERRLGVRLPASYRAFLLISNGAEADLLSACRVPPPCNGLLRAKDIAPIAEVDPGLVELWTGIPELNDAAQERHPTGTERMVVTYYKPMRAGLALNAGAQSERVVLVPRAGFEEWEVWLFHWEGAEAVAAFAECLLNVVEQPARRPDPAQADQYVADVRAGDRGKLLWLAELDDPRTCELACEVLLDESIPEVERCAATRPLELMADPSSVPCLRSAYARASMEPLRWQIITALRACGDHTMDSRRRRC